MTVTVSVSFLHVIPAPKASWIPEAPRHFEESQWGPEKRASEEEEEERGGRITCVSMVSGKIDEMWSPCVRSDVIHGLKYKPLVSKQ